MIISVDDVKSHLRIENDEEDELIESLIKQAQSAAEDFCRVNFDELESVPEAVKLAVLLMTSHYYEERDNPDMTIYHTMREAFENLLYPHREPMKMF